MLRLLFLAIVGVVVEAWGKIGHEVRLLLVQYLMCYSYPKILSSPS